MVKKIIGIAGVLIAALTSNFAHSENDANSWWSAGDCYGTVMGASLFFGWKPADTSPPIIDAMVRYGKKFNEIEPKYKSCQSNSKSLAEFQSCLNNIQPKSSADFANGYANGLGYTKTKGAQAAMVSAAYICPAVTIK